MSKTIGIWVIFGLVVFHCGCNFQAMSRAEDIKCYRVLKQILDDVRANRDNPSQLALVVANGRITCQAIANDLKAKANRDEPAKQLMLWAARDDFLRAAKDGFAKESKSELTFAERLQEAAYELGLEKRPGN